MCQSGIFRELEVQVNEKRLRLPQPRLLHEIQGAILLHHQIIVEKVQELRIIIVSHKPFALETCRSVGHPAQGSLLAMPMLATTFVEKCVERMSIITV
jgi:hypothetical protein